MLYFSAGIATSSALGDIQPVSTQARLSVTSEVLIEVIFIGLFLNSLAHDIGRALISTQKTEEKTNRIVSNTNEERTTKRAESALRLGGRAAARAASQKRSKKDTTPGKKRKKRITRRAE
jgi:hypothetical protein